MKARFLSIGLLALSLALTYFPASQVPSEQPEKRLSTFPLEFDGWSGKEDPFDASVMAAVATDDDLHRQYEGDDGKVWLYVGYYGTKKGGRTGHLPHHCYPAAGFKVLDLAKEQIFYGKGQSAWVNRILIERNGRLTVALYWIQSGDQKVLSDGFAMNMSRLQRRLFHGKDDGAFIRISSLVWDETPKAALEREKKFAAQFLERIGDHWPKEGGSKTSDQLVRINGESDSSTDSL